MEKWKSGLDSFQFGRKLEIGLNSLGAPVLIKEALLQQDKIVVEACEEGDIKEGDAKTILENVVNWGGKLFYKHISEHSSSHIWIWDHTMVELELSGKTFCSIRALSHSEEFIVNLRKMIKPFFCLPVMQGHIYAIVMSSGRLALNNIGNAGIPLIRENYSAKVIENYDYIIKDMKSQHPSGRISILEGPPGTGKTHLVRAMLMEVPDAMFVLVSPDMVSSLVGPELLPLLLTYRHATTGPIVLILEDADKCLVTRAGDNINSIQSLLNLGDGILGSLLDLRIIATTNAKKLEMEPAILRIGRLCKRLEVGNLSPKEGAFIFKRLVPNIEEVPVKLANTKDISLAEVYGLARSFGWAPEVRDVKNEDGFDNSDDNQRRR